MTQPIFCETAENQPVHEFVSPLIAVRKGGEQSVVGTAFFIGRGFAVTAQHVIADYLEKYEGTRDLGAADSNTSFHMLMYTSINEGRDLMPYRVLRTWYSRTTDLAVMAMDVVGEWPKDGKWLCPLVSLRPPKVGTPVAGFGFPESEMQSLEPAGNFRLGVRPRTSTGVVREIHHERRDSARLPFPCFRVNARIDGGMSGGPVIDNAGRVCGVMCQSLPPSAEGEEHASYASTLWPIAAIMIDVGNGLINSGIYTPFLEQFRLGNASAIDLKHVSVEVDPNGRQTAHTRYSRAEWDNPTVMAIRSGRPLEVLRNP